jgi:hypothetical protein
LIIKKRPCKVLIQHRFDDGTFIDLAVENGKGIESFVEKGTMVD